MNKEKRRVPKLRFPGFTEDWEQRKLSEVVTINPKTELPDEFKYVDLESVVGTNLLGFKVIKKENAPSRAQRLASYGDVFYQTVRPYQRNNYLFENVDKDVVFSTGYAQLRSKLDSYFLLTLVQNDNFVKVVLDNCTGTSYPAINGSELGKITVQIPSNEVEANQIGKVFRGIDKSITLHQRKLEHLNLKKKALLQKLFPKNGERHPELRFPGFTDAWEQRKLGEFVKIVSGDAPSTFISGNCIYVKVDDLNYSDRIQLSSSNLVNANSKAHLVNQGATIFPKRGAAIMTNKVRIMGKDGYLDTNMMALIPEEIDKDFLFTFIQKTGLYKIADTSTIPQINNKHIEPYIIQVPSEKEQAYIGVVFEKIDKIITLHQRKLEHLQLQKKALLQQMFV